MDEQKKYVFASLTNAVYCFVLAVKREGAAMEFGAIEILGMEFGEIEINILGIVLDHSRQKLMVREHKLIKGNVYLPKDMCLNMA